MKQNVVAAVLLAVAACAAGCRSGKPAAGAESAGTAQVSAAVHSTATVPPQSAPTPATPVSPSPHPAALQGPIRINAGSSAITDAAGIHWLGDTGFTGGDVIERPDLAIANTDAPGIYRSEHYAMDSFAWPVPDGKYQVKLHFCETFEGIAGPGERVFSFKVEDKEFKDFDVWEKAGGWGKAYVETVNVEVRDGQLNVQFTPQVENPQINGIEIIPVKQE